MDLKKQLSHAVSSLKLREQELDHQVKLNDEKDREVERIRRSVQAQSESGEVSLPSFHRLTYISVCLRCLA